MNKKIGVLITNLGTPDAPTKRALKVYLKQFLSDKRVVESQMPNWLWWCILNIGILNIRPQKSAISYQKVWGKFGNGSPLLDISLKQCDLIANKLGENYQVELGMRYGNPSIKSALDNLKNCDKIIVLPLYPQYSASTTGSTFDEISNVFSQIRVIPAIKFINKYFDNQEYIQALAKSIKNHWENFGKADKLIISYHGIPQRYVESGDPYQEHCEKTTKLLVEKLSLKDDEYFMAYQSRFGREKWLSPYLDKTLVDFAKNGIKKVQVICPGFSSDCLETIEEIDEENRAYFLNAGGSKFEYIPALNFDDNHIDLLANIIKE